MKYFILVLSLCSSLSFASTVFERKACLNRFSPELYRFTRLQNIWLTNKDSNLNILNNFRELRKFHEGYFKAIQDYKDQVLPKSKTTQELLKALSDLDEKQRIITDSLSSSLERDSKFLMALHDIDIALEEIAGRLSQTTNGCSPQMTADVNTLRAQVTGWRRSIENYKNYTAESRAKRVALFELVHQTLKYKLKKDFAESVGENVEKAIKQIDNIYLADKIQKEMMTWWMNKTRGNFLGNKTPKEAKEYLYSLLVQLDNYKAQIDKIENLQLAKDQLMMTQSGYERTVMNELRRREARE